MKNIIKKCVIVPLVFLFIGGSANANSAEFVNVDGSDNTALCIAAATSAEALAAKKAELNAADFNGYTCNGYDLNEFADTYRGALSSEPIHVFAFSGETNKPSARICIAAATSNKALKEAMKSAKLAKNSAYLVRCEGQTLKRFAKNNGNKLFRI